MNLKSFLSRISINFQKDNFLIFLTISILLLNAINFTYLNADPHVRGDGWRFIEMFLVPYSLGNLTIVDLFNDHHPLPLAPLLFIFNAEFFKLRMDYEAFVGLFFILCNSLIIISEMKKNSYSLLGILVKIFVCISMTHPITFVWSLVTIGYIYFFLGSIVIFSINNFLKKLNKSRLMLLFLLLHSFY